MITLQHFNTNYIYEDYIPYSIPDSLALTFCRFPLHTLYHYFTLAPCNYFSHLENNLRFIIFHFKPSQQPFMSVKFNKNHWFWLMLFYWAPQYILVLSFGCRRLSICGRCTRNVKTKKVNIYAYVCKERREQREKNHTVTLEIVVFSTFSKGWIRLLLFLSRWISVRG